MSVTAWRLLENTDSERFIVPTNKTNFAPRISRKLEILDENSKTCRDIYRVGQLLLCLVSTLPIGSTLLKNLSRNSCGVTAHMEVWKVN